MYRVAGLIKVVTASRSASKMRAARPPWLRVEPWQDTILLRLYFLPAAILGGAVACSSVDEIRPNVVFFSFLFLLFVLGFRFLMGFIKDTLRSRDLTRISIFGYRDKNVRRK